MSNEQIVNQMVRRLVNQSVGEIVDRYARKPAKGQSSLFDDRQPSLFGKKEESAGVAEKNPKPKATRLSDDDEDEEGGRWVTIRGSHVFIGADDKIKKGPKAFIGLSPDDAIEAHEAERKAEKERARFGGSAVRPGNQKGLFETPASDSLKKPFRDELHPREKDSVPNPNRKPGQFAPKGGSNPMVRVSELESGKWSAYAMLQNGEELRVDGDTRREAISAAVKKAEKLGVVLDYPKDEGEIGGLFSGGKPSSDPDDEPFSLQQPKPKSKKPEFDDNENANQKSLFDAGKKGELKGQELLFNSDAGDLNNPKTMENRVKDQDASASPVAAKDIAAEAIRNNENISETMRRHGYKFSDPIRNEIADHVTEMKEAAKAAEDSAKPAPSPGRQRAMEKQKAAEEPKTAEPTLPPAEEQSISKFRPDVDISSVLTPAGQLKASSRTGANAPWTYQGTIDLVHMNAADQTINGQHYPASEHAKKSSAIVRAAGKAGYKLRNFRAGSRGTVWAYTKGDKILTQRGAELLLSGGDMSGFDAGEGREKSHDSIKKFTTFAESLGDSVPSLGTLSAALNRSPLGDHLKIERDRNGEIRLSAKNGSWHVYEGTQEYRDGETTQHESSIERFLSKLKHMAKTEIPDDYGGWAQHDRAADAASFKSSPSADSGPNDGDINAEGLVFRDGRWHRNEEEKPEEPSSSSADSDTFDPEKHGDYRSLVNLGRRIDSGDIDLEEFQQAHKFYSENREAFIADLAKRYDAKSLKNIAANLGDWSAVRGENKKLQNAASVYSSMMQHAFNVGEGISNTYSHEEITAEGGMSAATVSRLAAHVAKQTPESLADHVAGQAKSIAEREAASKAEDEAATNPKTLKDFGLAIRRAGGYQKLSPEQQAMHDDLKADETRSSRDEKKSPTAVQVNVSGDHGGFELTKNFHSKRGQDIFTASPNNRVDRDEYTKMNTAAKRLGGWYYKAFGGTPGGFHFPDEDKRNRFLQAMAGESVDRSDILGSKQNEREKSVGEKLADHAQRLEERASSSYSAERKENTNRRAGMAASARASAEHDLNQAVRLRSISEAMSNGESKHLRGMHALTQLEALQRVWKQAQRKHEEQKLQEKYGDDWRKNSSHSEHENTYQSSVNADSVAHAQMPRQVIYPANVQKFLEQAASTPGLKQESAKWQKIFKRNTSDEKEQLTLSNQGSKDWFDFANRAKSKGVKHEWSGFGQKDDFQRLHAMGIQEDHELRAALRELAPHQEKRHGSVKKDPVIELEKKIHREHKEQGFYPTPPRVIDRLMEHADIRDGHSILEPSAGSGRIMDAVRSTHGDAVSLKGIEHHSSLQDLLKMKGHDVEHGDFLEHKGEYDRIVMNPPFENDAAIDHVRHAFGMLKPGGKLVAVIPGDEHLYRNASRSKRKQFAEFADEHGGEFEALPESSFAGSDAPRQTGVRTSIVVLQKPGESAVSPDAYSRTDLYLSASSAARLTVERYSRVAPEQIRPDQYTLSPLVKGIIGAGGLMLTDSVLSPGSRNAGTRMLNRLIKGAVTAAVAAWIAQSSSTKADGGTAGAGVTDGQNQEQTDSDSAALPTPAVPSASPAAESSFKQKWGVDLNGLIAKSIQNAAAASSGWKDQNRQVFGGPSAGGSSVKSDPKSQTSGESGGGPASSTGDSSNDPDGKWITIGGHPGKDGRHMGGTPVQVDESGNILKGPDAIEGQDIDDLGDGGGGSGQQAQQPSDHQSQQPSNPWEKSGNISLGPTKTIDIDESQPLHQPEERSVTDVLSNPAHEKRLKEQAEAAERAAAEQETSFNPDELDAQSSSQAPDSHRKKAIGESNLNQLALDYDLTPDELRQAAEDELASMADYHKQREAAKKELRDRTGLNAANIRLMANRKGKGSDPSTLRRFDEASDVENHGIDGGGTSALRAAGVTDESSAYDLAMEGSQELPGLHDLEWLESIAERLYQARLKHNENPENFRNAGQKVDLSPVYNDRGEPVPFSRTSARSDTRTSIRPDIKSAIRMSVDQYVRRLLKTSDSVNRTSHSM